jgi:hypothetical protein
MEFPYMVKVRQRLHCSPLENPQESLEIGLERACFGSVFTGGTRVAVAVGSRKIDGLVPLLSRLVERFREGGCRPYIVPAMGSHGGATPEGQARLLASLGVTEESVKAPVRSGMETVAVGMTTEGAVAFVDSLAMEADAIVLVNRVAPHTAYSGPVESGLAKMMAVGLGNRWGARSLHKHGFGAGHLIGEIADVVLEAAPVEAGVALVQDGTKKLARIEVLSKDEIRNREPALLKAAVEMHPRLPVSYADLLIVDEMGKDISGIGMDPLVTGRGKEAPSGSSPGFTAVRLVVLGLSRGSAGNATGIGHADVTTERLVHSIDRWVTYRNVVTSGALYRARLPVMLPTDRDAVSVAIESLGGIPASEVRAVRIKDTAHMEDLQVSTALADELRGLEGVEVGVEAREMEFDPDGNIV